MSKEKLNSSLLLLASEILGDTSTGLSGSQIASHSNYFSVEFNIDIPYPEYPFPQELPNKRTALRENLKQFNKEQQIQIIETLCNLEKFADNEKAKELLSKIQDQKSTIAAHPNQEISQKEKTIVKTKEKTNQGQDKTESSNNNDFGSIEKGPTKKLQKWQLIIAALALISFVAISFHQISNNKSQETKEYKPESNQPEVNYDEINRDTTTSQSTNELENKKDEIFQTRYLGGYSTVDAYDGQISITNEGFIEYVNEKISLKVSSPKSDLRKYDGLTIGDKINYGEYEIKLYDLRRNVSTYDIELRIYK